VTRQRRQVADFTRKYAKFRHRDTRAICLALHLVQYAEQLKAEVAVIARIAVGLASLVLGATQSGSVRAQADFFRGKTLTMLIGYTSGGGYDLYARVLSKHMGRHIPGSPSIVPQNMPGPAASASPMCSTTPPPRMA
jgi:hypothetical protein